METGSPKDHPEIWEGVQGGTPTWKRWLSRSRRSEGNGGRRTQARRDFHLNCRNMICTNQMAGKQF